MTIGRSRLTRAVYVHKKSKKFLSFSYDFLRQQTASFQMAGFML